MTQVKAMRIMLVLRKEVAFRACCKILETSSFEIVEIFFGVLCFFGVALTLRTDKRFPFLDCPVSNVGPGP
jgi:hypothetical protein